MKTIVENITLVSKYIYDDQIAITFLTDQIVTPNFTICDLNNSNATLYENITPPDDWFASKYLFDGTTWTLNPNWSESVV